MDSDEKKWFLGNIVCWPLIVVGIIVAHEVSVWLGILFTLIVFGTWVRLAWWFMNE